MISEIRLDSFEMVEDIIRSSEKELKIGEIARQALPVLDLQKVVSMLDPQRVATVVTYLMEQVEMLRYCDLFHVAMGHGDREKMDAILDQMIAAPEAGFRNQLLQSLASEAAEEGDVALMNRFMEKCEGIVVLDEQMAHDMIRVSIEHGDEEGALQFLAKLDPAIDFSSEAEDLLEWAMEMNGVEMPSLRAALEERCH